MINITSLISAVSNFPSNLSDLLKSRYDITDSTVTNSVNKVVEYIKKFNEGTYFVIEHPYVDKLYRDTYYNYYASKLDDYSRDSIKISVFSIEVTQADFRTRNSLGKLTDNYLGFFIVRPTFPSVIGRSVLSPRAFQLENIVLCQSVFNVTVDGAKFNAIGFPHSSQDSETITCAETTIWSIIEYFSHKYPEYRPILPSQITSVLSKFSVERLIPSKGLSAALISYTLKELGFGVKIYAKGSYGADFELLLKTYVDSGIPVVCAMSNTNGIGHAFNIIGREIPTEANIDNIQLVETYDDGTNTLSIYDYYTMPLNYVFIDDNIQTQSGVAVK